MECTVLYELCSQVLTQLSVTCKQCTLEKVTVKCDLSPCVTRGTSDLFVPHVFARGSHPAFLICLHMYVHSTYCKLAGWLGKRLSPICMHPAYKQISKYKMYPPWMVAPHPAYFFFLPLCRFKMIWMTPKDKFFRRWRDQDPKVADFDQSITQYIELSNKVGLLSEGSSANPTFILSFVILSHLIPVT